MILYLYALADRVDSLDGLAGVGDEPLLQIDVDGAQLIAGWLAAPPPIERATLEAQDRVIRVLHERAGALLPMRFGTAVAGIDAAVRAVSGVAGTLPERLDLVRGREQMTVRALRRLGATGAAGSTGSGGANDAPGALGALGATGATGATGTSYLRTRAIRDVPPEIAPVVEGTRTLARATRVEQGTSDLLATVYQLVERGRGSEYREQVELIAAALPHLTLRVSGPSPAYAFTSE